LDAVLGLGLGFVVVLGASAVISCRCGRWGRCGVSSHNSRTGTWQRRNVWFVLCKRKGTIPVQI